MGQNFDILAKQIKVFLTDFDQDYPNLAKLKGVLFKISWIFSLLFKKHHHFPYFTN
jgi:hypothetical protein